VNTAPGSLLIFFCLSLCSSALQTFPCRCLFFSKFKKKFFFSDSDSDLDDGQRAGRPLAESTPAPAATKKGPKPKYHTSLTGRGVTAGTARPRFSSSSENDVSSNDELTANELASSDLDTDFSADEKTMVKPSTTPSAATSKRATKMTPKVAAMKETEKNASSDEAASTPTIKLKIKLPSTSSMPTEVDSPKSRGAEAGKRRKKSNLKEAKASKVMKKSNHYGFADFGPPGRKKSTDAWSANRRDDSSSSESVDSDNLVMDESDVSTNVGAATQDPAVNEKLYCVCQCPHDDVSEMIGCDAPDCRLEWFHFECVGIMIPPKGQWFCPECRDRYNIKNRNFW